MSDAVVRAESALFAYITALHTALHVAAEDALPQSLWDGDADNTGCNGEREGQSIAPAEGGSSEAMPDTLLQRVERETAQEKHRIRELLRRHVTPQQAALRAAIVQLGGGQDAKGNILDVPVATLDEEIAAAAAESAELGRRMVELYDEAAELATRIEAEVMNTTVPSL